MKFHIAGVSLPSESYAKYCRMVEISELKFLDKMYLYLERIATDRIKGGKLVLPESSAAQRHPEAQ